MSIVDLTMTRLSREYGIAATKERSSLISVNGSWCSRASDEKPRGCAPEFHQAGDLGRERPALHGFPDSLPVPAPGCLSHGS